MLLFESQHMETSASNMESFTPKDGISSGNDRHMGFWSWGSLKFGGTSVVVAVPEGPHQLIRRMATWRNLSMRHDGGGVP